ncbi:MAG: hypothetical protein EAS51_08430 [Microbacteriaceae bacterium]|nr:MAG: hypothetical protein EAS51_08430 [Microbacteriaceae bacterium]
MNPEPAGAGGVEACGGVAGDTDAGGVDAGRVTGSAVGTPGAGGCCPAWAPNWAASQSLADCSSSSRGRSFMAG